MIIVNNLLLHLVCMMNEKKNLRMIVLYSLDLNLVDWSNSNILAVALGANVYLWNAGTGTIEQLFELEENDYVCSVGWIQEGPYLAVGTTIGNTELWDCSQMKRMRIMNGHSSRVGSLSWNAHVLSSGCR